jgi:hypothetical protein
MAGSSTRSTKAQGHPCAKRITLPDSSLPVPDSSLFGFFGLWAGDVAVRHEYGSARVRLSCKEFAHDFARPYAPRHRFPRRKEIKRRMRVATLLPNEASLQRLGSAGLAEISDDWDAERAYLTIEAR